MQVQRLKWIDVLKGVAILLVVLQHACGSLYNGGMFTDALMTGIIEEIGLFHMPLFMVIAGYVFCLAYTSQGELLVKKTIIHIGDMVVVYCVFSVIRYIIKVMFANEVNKVIASDSILFIWKTAIDELWFLYALIVIYIVMMLLLPKGKIVQYIMFVGGIVYYVWDPSINTTLNEAAKYIVFFLLGVFYFYNTSEHKHIRGRTWILCEILLLIGCRFALVSFSDNTFLDRLFSLFVACLVCDILFWGAYYLDDKNILENTKALQYLGENTLIIYLFHIYCTSGARVILREAEISSWVIVVCVLTALGLAIPLAIDKVLSYLHLKQVIFSPVSVIAKKEKNCRL